MPSPSNLKQSLILGEVATLRRSTEPYFYEAAYLHSKGFLISVNGEGKCVLARAHPEGDSATDAGTNRCPQGVPKMSQIRSVGSGNFLHNANHLTVYT